MYAVVTTGGKQYRVEAGSELTIERVAVEAGDPITFDRVLMVGDGDSVTIGTPTVEGASVSGTVIGQALGPKLIIFKFKQKATYRRKNGHRQHMTRVRIDEISAAGKKSRADAPEAKAEKPVKAEKSVKAESTASAAEKSGAKAESKSATADKPKRTRKPAAKAAAAESTDEPKAKPAPRRRATAKKAESEE